MSSRIRKKASSRLAWFKEASRKLVRGAIVASTVARKAVALDRRDGDVMTGRLPRHPTQQKRSLVSLSSSRSTPRGVQGLSLDESGTPTAFRQSDYSGDVEIIQKRRHMTRAFRCMSLAVGIIVASSCISQGALACGVPPPGAPPGFRCTEGDAEKSPRFHTGAGYTFSSTRISFSNGAKADVDRHLVSSSLEVRASPAWTLQAGAGLLLSGDMRFPVARFAFAGGASFSVGASYRLVEEKGALPFVGITTTLGYATAKTHERFGPTIGYNAFDLRIGGIVGKSIADVVTVYAAARVFGGPIFWKFRNEAVTGTDVYKYQLGAGASLLLARRIDLFIEGIALGERLVTAGLGISY